MIDYCSKDKRYGIDRSKERLRRAEEQYHARISEAGLILVYRLVLFAVLAIFTKRITWGIQVTIILEASLFYTTH